MHRIDSNGASEEGLFLAGNPAAGEKSTEVTPAWLNDLQESLCRLIERAGIELSKGDFDQLWQAFEYYGVAAGLRGYTTADEMNTDLSWPSKTLAVLADDPDGTVYRKDGDPGSGDWTATSIRLRGDQGLQGLQGEQGIQGEQGDSGADMLSVATLAALTSDLSAPDGTPRLVTNDPDPQNNGTWRKEGATGTGSWVPSSYDRVALVEQDVSTMVEDVGYLQSYREFDRIRRQQGDCNPKAAVVILLGQSLNAVRGDIVQAKSAPIAKMPVGGASITQWGFYPTNATWIGHWDELATVVGYEETGGQTPGVGIIGTLAGGKFGRIYLGNVAIGARPLETLMIGGPVVNLWATLQRLCQIARNDGYDPEVMFYTAHGEANSAIATSEDTYYALGQEYYGRAQLWAAQAMRRPDYHAPIVFTHPGTQAAGDNDRAIKAAIKRLALDLPGGIDLGGVYQWPLGADRVHPTEISYVQRGEAVGRALRKYTSDVRELDTLYMTDVTLDGAEFVATFSAPVERDDTFGVGENLNPALAMDGFEWIDNGVGIKITGLFYAGQKVRGTLEHVPVGTIDQQVLRIAEQTTTSALTIGFENTAGSLVRAQGSGWPSLYDYTYTNHVWAAPQTYTGVRAA